MEKNLHEIEISIKKQRKLLNFRLPLALFILAGLTCVIVAFCGVYTLFINVALLLFAIAYTIYLLMRGKKLIKFILFIVLSLLVVNGCILQFTVQVQKYNAPIALEEPITVRGSVVEIASSSEFSKTLLVKTEKMTTTEHKVIKNAYIKLTVNGITEVGIGSSIEFTTTLQKYTFTKPTENLTNCIENIQYYAKVNAKAIKIVPATEFNLFIYLRQKVYTLLFDNFDSEIAAFAYAMLIGDNNFLEQESLQNIRYAGIAHIFAISGLHIGILYGLLYALFKRLPLPKWIKFLLIAGILFMYSGVCRFSASTLRATIMALLTLFCHFTFRKKDAINRLSIAGLILLCIQPLQIFSVGFQLSFVAVFALTVIAPHFVRLCKCKGKWKKLLQAIILPTTVQLATFPFLLNYFGYTSILSLLVNIIFVPILSMVFTLLFGAMLLALCITPLAKILLFIPMWLLKLVVTPLMLFSFKVLLVSGFAFGTGAIFAWLLLLFILSDKVNLSSIAKLVATISLLLTIVLLFVLQTVLPNASTRIVLTRQYDSSLVLLQEEDKNYLFTDSKLSQNFINGYLLRQNVQQIEGLYLFSADAKYINSVVPTIHRIAPVKNVYTLTDSVENTFAGIQTHNMHTTFSVGSFKGDIVGSGAIKLANANITILLVYQFEEILYPNVDILIAKNYSSQLAQLTMPNYAFYFTSDTIEVGQNAHVLTTMQTIDILLPKGKQYAVYHT